MERLIPDIPQPGVIGGTSCEEDLQELLHQIDIMLRYRREEWEQQNQELQVQLQERETELIQIRSQAAEWKRIQKEMVGGYEERLGSLRSELDQLKSSYSRLLHHHFRQGRHYKMEKDTTFGSDTLSKKIEEFQMKSKEWEKQRSSYQKDLAILEASRRSLAAKYQLFQRANGSGRDELTGRLWSEKQADRVTERSEDARRDAEAGGGEPDTEKEQRIEELGHVPKLREKSEENLNELEVELHTRGSELQAKELEDGLQEEEVRLGEQLSAQDSTYRLENSQVSVTAELRRLRGDMERVKRQLGTSKLQEELLQGKIAGLQTGLESSHSLTRQLQRTLGRTEDELCSLRHAGRFKDGETDKLREELVKLQSERTEIETLRAENLHLEAKLRDRECTIASANHREAQLQRELQTVKGKATEYQVAKIELEALSLENKQLKELISEMETKPARLVLLKDPCGDDVAGDTQPRDQEGQRAQEERPHEDPNSTVQMNQQSNCWEETEARGGPSARSSSPKPEDCPHLHGNSHRKEESRAYVGEASEEVGEEPLLQPPSSRHSDADHFFQEEEERIKELEQQFDSYIHELHSNTQSILQRYSLCRPGNCGASTEIQSLQKAVTFI